MTESQPFPPSAYIVGAPKCGTTALAAYLAEHPAIAFTEPKEPHFFADDLPGLRLTDDETAYRRMLPEKAATVTMEGSVWYLMSRTAVPRILAARPDAKFIVMLRDPIEMAVSLHVTLRLALDENVADFAEAWRLSPERAAGRALPRLCRAPATLVYDEACSTGGQLERFFAATRPEQRLVLFQEELGADTPGVYRRALDFLGLPDDGRTEFERVNEAALPRSKLLHALIQRDWAIKRMIGAPIKRLLGVERFDVQRRLRSMNLAKPERTVLPEALRAEMVERFRPQVAKISALLGRDVAAEFGWRDFAA